MYYLCAKWYSQKLAECKWPPTTQHSTNLLRGQHSRTAIKTMKSGRLATRTGTQRFRMRVTHRSLLAILSASPLNLRHRGGTFWVDNLTCHFASRPLTSMLNVGVCALWIWNKYKVLWFLPASLTEAMGMKYSSTPSKTIFLDRNESLIRPEIGHTGPRRLCGGKKLMSHRVGNTTKRRRSYIFF